MFFPPDKFVVRRRPKGFDANSLYHQLGWEYWAGEDKWMPNMVSSFVFAYAVNVSECETCSTNILNHNHTMMTGSNSVYDY